MYPPGKIAQLLHSYVKVATTVPDEMALVAQVFPSERGPAFLILVCHCGRSDVGNDLLKPLRGPIQPMTDTVKLMPYLEAQSSGFPQAAQRNAYFATSLFLPEISDTAIAEITTATQDQSSRYRVLISRFHGAVTRTPSADMAFAFCRVTGALQVKRRVQCNGRKIFAPIWNRSRMACTSMD